VIVTPTSLVNNWKAELSKWLEQRVTAIALSEASKDSVIDGITHFLQPTCKSPVLIISYDTFRRHYERFTKKG
jgi:SNF2 family DNA or RNA helicase